MQTDKSEAEKRVSKGIRKVNSLCCSDIDAWTNIAGESVNCPDPWFGGGDLKRCTIWRALDLAKWIWSLALPMYPMA